MNMDDDISPPGQPIDDADLARIKAEIERRDREDDEPDEGGTDA